MDLFEAIKTRRSIRSFTEEPVSQEDMDRMLEAAMCAPSANNRQLWHFVVIRDREMLRKVAEVHPYAKMAAGAAAAVIICADLNEEKTPGFWVQDCSAATQNFMLAARALNIGTVWCGLHPIEDRARPFCEIFHMPDNIRPLSLIVLGHTDQEFKAQERFRAERVHNEDW